MTLSPAFAPGLATVTSILALMAAVALVETAIPLHARGRSGRDHLAPNLALTFLTFGTNLLLNAALLTALFALQARGFGLLHAVSLPPLAAAAVAVAVLDFSFYVAHVAMHMLPSLWRFHAVHHSDPAVDVTTTIRQHPGESLIRYAFLTAFALALGPSPLAFGVYRAWSAINGLFEHANVRAPLWLDRLLSWVTTWPHMHKVHHSRVPAESNTNFGNLFSLWDRLFSTFTPSWRGARIGYGLEGLDDPATQTTAGLLALPFRHRARIGLAPGPQAVAAAEASVPRMGSARQSARSNTSWTEPMWRSSKPASQ